MDLKTIRQYLVLFILLSKAFSANAGQQDINIDTLENKTRISFFAGPDFYRAFSQKKNSMVMKMGYPVFESLAFRMGTELLFPGDRLDHRLNFSFSRAIDFYSDDGLGNDFILDKDGSYFSSLLLEHQMSGKLFSLQKIDAFFSPAAGLDYQKRTLKYSGNLNESTWDLNLFLGLGGKAQLDHKDKLVFQAGFDSFVYLPWLNHGRLIKTDTNGQTIDKVNYRAFYYRTRFSIHGEYTFNSGKSIYLLYMKNSTVGFANREAMLYIDELIHYRMEYVNSVSIGFRF